MLDEDIKNEILKDFRIWHSNTYADGRDPAVQVENFFYDQTSTDPEAERTSWYDHPEADEIRTFLISHIRQRNL